MGCQVRGRWRGRPLRLRFGSAFGGVVATMRGVAHAFDSSRIDAQVSWATRDLRQPFVVSALANDFLCRWAGPSGPAH
jgi:hypothetical protein